MRLKRLKLYNFRSFGGDREHVIEFDDLNALVGANGTGKTSALVALNYLFSPYSGDRNLVASDFYIPHGSNPDERTKLSLYIEAVFVFDRLHEGREDYAIPCFFEHVVVTEPDGDPYLRIRLDATLNRDSILEGSIDSQIRYIKSEENRDLLDTFCVTASRHDLDKIRFIYVPAVRDPLKLFKRFSGAMVYQLIKRINWSEDIKKLIKGKSDELNTELNRERGMDTLTQALGSSWKEYNPAEKYNQVALNFEGSTFEALVKHIEVNFKPAENNEGFTVDQLSDGLRSLFYISLIDSGLDIEGIIKEEQMTNSEKPTFNIVLPILTILAVEEPENHIAPHLLGRLVTNLTKLAAKSDAQILLTSHSPSIIKRIEPQNIRYFRLGEDRCSDTTEISLPDKSAEEFKYVKEAVKAHPELYFAKLVILGEGDSEEVIIQKFWEIQKGKLDLQEISVVPLGGRHVNYFWKLLNNLHIPYVTLLDLDLGRSEGGCQRIKYVVEQLQTQGIYDPILLNNEQIKRLTNCNKDNTLELNKEIINNKDVFNVLEEHNVYFSSPLDLDFMMLEHYFDNYKGILTKDEGPRITYNGTRIKIDSHAEALKEFRERMNEDIKAVLKSQGSQGEEYNEEQKKLMIWYNYFFLNRGKPVTHMLMLSSIAEEDLKSHIPEVFKRMFKKIDVLLDKD